MAEYPCGTCYTQLTDNDSSILCNLCNKWHHSICVDVTNANYEKLEEDLTPGFARHVLKKYPSLP